MYIHVALIITVFGIGYIAKLPMEMLINIVFIYFYENFNAWHKDDKIAAACTIWKNGLVHESMYR